MHTSAVFAAHNNKATVVSIGPINQALSMKELEEIRDWVNDHKDVWPACSKEMPSLFGYTFEIKVWPAIKNDKKYVWLVENYFFFSEVDTKAWQDIFDESIDNDDYIVFVAEPTSLTRLNKDLLPFL